MTLNKLAPPRADKRPVTETWHGLSKHDNYKWLKADNWQEVMQDPSVLPADIRAYLEAENAYTKEQMAPTEALQEKLFAELKGRIKEDDQSVPAPDGPYIYSSSYVIGGQYPLIKRRPKAGGDEELLFDCNELAKGKSYFSLGGVARSPDHRLAAWSQDDKGSEFYEIRIREHATKVDLPDLLLNTSGGATWSADGQYIFYTIQDEHHRPLKSYRHKLGTAQSEDVLVFEETDTGMFTGLGATHSDRYIVISVHDHDTSECWIIDAEKPLEQPKLVAAREPGATPAFESVRGAVAAALQQQGFVTALRQYLRLLAGAAQIEGVDLEGAATPLVQ